MYTSVEKLLPKNTKILSVDHYSFIMESPCNCESSPFKYEPLGHIVKVTLILYLTYLLVRSYMSYGCKYRVPINIPSSEIINTLTHYISEFIKKKGRKHSIGASNLYNWQCRLLDIIQKTHRIIF